MDIPVGVQQTTIVVAVEGTEAVGVTIAEEEIVGVDRGQEVEAAMRTTGEVVAEEGIAVTTMTVDKIAGAVEEEVAAATG